MKKLMGTDICSSKGGKGVIESMQYGSWMGKYIYIYFFLFFSTSNIPFVNLPGADGTLRCYTVE